MPNATDSRFLNLIINGEVIVGLTGGFKRHQISVSVRATDGECARRRSARR